MTADVFRSRDNENETAYNRFVEQYQTLESIREHLRLDRQQCELEYERQQKFDHYGEV